MARRTVASNPDGSAPGCSARTPPIRLYALLALANGIAVSAAQASGEPFVSAIGVR